MARTPTTVYTDGACSGNPGPGGWAWAVPGGAWARGAAAYTTNQRMEIQAVLEAVTTIEGPVDVVSDSTYVVHCFRDRWWEGWMRKGWVNSQKKPVANRDLWEPLIETYRADPGRLRFRWVKGHSGDVMNDVVDRLAVAAALEQTDAGAAAPPSGLGAADSPAPSSRSVGRPAPSATSKPTPSATPSPYSSDTPSGAQPEPPVGHRVVIAGLKPPALGGYDDPPQATEVLDRLREILAAKAEIEPDVVVLTGMGLGSEQIGARAASEAGVPYVAVLAYPDQDRVWPGPSREHHARLLSGSHQRIVLESRAPASKQAAGAALARRDAWLARHAHEAIVVWDGVDVAVGRALRSLQDHLGEEQVWLIEIAPATPAR